MGAELEKLTDNPAVREILRQWKKAGGLYKIAAEEVEKELKEKESVK